jgi:hypothetical protein
LFPPTGGAAEQKKIAIISVADPDPNPDPYVFGPPGSGSVSQRYRSRAFFHQAKLVRKSLVPTVLFCLRKLEALQKKKKVAIISFADPNSNPDP